MTHLNVRRLSPFPPVSRFPLSVFHHLVAGHSLGRPGDLQAHMHYPEREIDFFNRMFYQLLLCSA